MSVLKSKVKEIAIVVAIATTFAVGLFAAKTVIAQVGGQLAADKPKSEIAEATGTAAPMEDRQ